MPLAGGAAAKLGVRFEGHWTNLAISDVLAEEAVAIWFEQPEEEGEGVEFRLSRPGGDHEYHQAKRQSPRGRWTIAALREGGVLAAAWARLAEPEATFHFASQSSADELRELAERARQAQTAELFSSAFVSDRRLAPALTELRQAWGGVSESEAYQVLKRLRVRTNDEETLHKNVRFRLRTLVLGNPARAADFLFAFAFDHIHHELTTHDLWRELEQKDFRRQRWADDDLVIARVDAQNRRYISRLRRDLISGQALPRVEATEALAEIGFGERRGLLMHGPAGVGKSGVLREVVETLAADGVPLLAIRVDTLPPNERADVIGRALGLPESPALVLGALARGRPALLVIDQLDAASLVAGRQTEIFEAVAEMLEQTHAYPEMRVLLACRTPDLEHDHRLRRLVGDDGVATPLAVGPLPTEDVRGVIAAFGLDPKRLDSKQFRLLAVPAHLALLAEVAPTGDAFTFASSKDLYDRYWEVKQQQLRESTGRVVAFVDVIDALCEAMSRERRLAAPVAFLDRWHDDAQAMTSAHVLVEDDGRYSFFHEGFFDYAFARRYTREGRSVLDLLRSGEQHLFRRAQTRQILLHERAGARERYLRALRELLTANDVRFHIKLAAVAVVAALPDPTAEEWHILAAAASTDRDLEREIVAALRGSLPWFSLLDEQGVIASWLAGEDSEAERALMLLFNVQARTGDRAAELIKPHHQRAAWPQWVLWLARGGSLGASRMLFEQFLSLIERGVFDEGADFFHHLHRLNRPEWSVEAIAAYLARQTTLAAAAGKPHPFVDRALGVGRMTWDDLQTTAREVPAAFAGALLPPALALMEANLSDEPRLPRRDQVWRSRGWRHDDLEDALLAALETALGTLARDDPAAFAPLATELESSGFDTAAYLVMRAYTIAGAPRAAEAAAAVARHPEWLEVDVRGDRGFAVRQMLKAVAAGLDAEALAPLEPLILDYYPDWERRADNRELFGSKQYSLLLALSAAPLSEVARRRLGEHVNKFGPWATDGEERIGFGSGYVGSPIPDDAAEKMSDEHWLSAIARYQVDEIRHHEGGTIGGSEELAQLLQAQVVRQPERFAAFVDRLDDETPREYFDAVLFGLREAEPDADSVTRVARRVHGLPGRPCGRALSWLLQRTADLNLPADVVAMAAWYATEDPDPSPGAEEREGSGDAMFVGINSTRGSAAQAIGNLVFHDASRVMALRPSLERLVDDQSLAVRYCAASALGGLMRHDRELAIALFERLAADLAVVRGKPGQEFLGYALRTHFARLRPLLERLLDDPESAEVGARMATIAAYHDPTARPLAESQARGGEAARVGLAAVLAVNLREWPDRDFCVRLLTPLFDDEAQAVREATAQLFHGFDGGDLGRFLDVVEAFIGSRAFAEHTTAVLDALQKTTARLPELVLDVAARFDALASEGASIQSARALDTATMSELLVRVYGQSADRPELETGALDALDRLLRQGVYGVADAIAQFER